VDNFWWVRVESLIVGFVLSPIGRKAPLGNVIPNISAYTADPPPIARVWRAGAFGLPSSSHTANSFQKG